MFYLRSGQEELPAGPSGWSAVPFRLRADVPRRPGDVTGRRTAQQDALRPRP